MDAVTLIQTAAYRIGIPAPATYGANSRLLYLLYGVAEELRSLKTWPQQKRTYSFTTTASRASYPVPADFYATLEDTGFNQTQHWRLVGPVSDGDWNYYLYGPGSGIISFRTRIFGPDANQNTLGGQMQLNPTPSDTQTVSYEYLSKNLFMPKNWAPSTAYTSGTYVNANGNIYLCDTNGTSHASTPPSGQTQNITDNTTRWDYVSTPYETVLASTDLMLFDDDLMLNGLIYRYLEARGFDYSKYEELFRRGIDSAQARWAGSFSGSLSGPEINRRYGPSTPGGWTF